MTPRRRPGLLLAGALAVGLLTSCSSTPALTDDAASQLQEAVQQVAQLSAADDFAGAQASLVTLQQQYDAQVAAGSITADRQTQIQASIDLVRTDLDAALLPTDEQTEEPVPEPEETTPEPTPTPEPTVTEEPEPTPTEEEEEDENEPDEDESPETPIPDPSVPVDAPVGPGAGNGPGNNGNGNSGPGNNNGNNGNGNGNGNSEDEEN